MTGPARKILQPSASQCLPRDPGTSRACIAQAAHGAANPGLERNARISRKCSGLCACTAEAEARATQVVSEAIAKGDVQALNYFVALKYTEAMAKIGSANNSKVVLMPMEASALVGSLGGIGALAREVFGAQTSGSAVQPARTRIPPTGNS